jgi:hypothetical protein
VQHWEYKVASVDYRGRISIEGQETLIGSERRTAFLRTFLDGLGAEGWELISIQPLTQHDAYYIFKRPTAHPSAAASASVGDETLSTL